MIYAEVKIAWSDFVNPKEKSSLNYMKMQKSVIFVKKNLKINMWKIKKYFQVRGHCHYTGGYGGDACSICNLKYIEYLKKFL